MRQCTPAAADFASGVTVARLENTTPDATVPGTPSKTSAPSAPVLRTTDATYARDVATTYAFLPGEDTHARRRNNPGRLAERLRLDGRQCGAGAVAAAEGGQMQLARQGPRVGGDLIE
jgi:hypothetical protein